MSLKTKLQKDLVDALKAKETVKLSTVRMLISAIQYKEANRSRWAELTETEEIDILTSEAKKRQESIDIFSKNNRPDLVEKEISELAVIRTYLPTQLSEAEVAAIIKSAVTTLDASCLKDLGRVMGIVVPQVKGKYDTKNIRSMVEKELSVQPAK